MHENHQNHEEAESYELVICKFFRSEFAMKKEFACLFSYFASDLEVS